jgi:putative ABC transport system permease protein
VFRVFRGGNILMTKFLLKGLLRDRHRSLFPVIIVAAGVAISVLLYCWMTGIMGDVVSTSAKLETGHVKIMTQAYEEIANQLPNDLAVFDLNELTAQLRQKYPEMDWAPRIKFGGLLDIPDENGETRAQGPVFGIGIDLLSPESQEKERLNLEDALVRGRLPQVAGEIVTSEQLAQNLGAKLGETATLISATSNGSMAIYNFILVGTVQFGVGAMDTGAMLADISDVQYALDMTDGASEILGYFPKMIFKAQAAYDMAADFNATFMNPDDEFSPMMLTLLDQNGMGEYLEYAKGWLGAIVVGFIGVMAIVLWNAGLMSGIRRYGEVGVRLAIGESKGHVYRSLISESIIIGLAGSIIGTAFGLFFSYILQEVGIDVSAMFQGASMMISNVIRARVTPPAAFIGFIPGLFGTVFGAMMAGIGIFKRQTARLFKELEA